MRRSGVKSRIPGYRFIAAVLVVLQLFCSGLWARPRAADEAEKVVTGWLKTNARPLGMTLGREVMNVETFTDDNGRPIYYIVYLQEPRKAGTQAAGFVVVSADDLVEPIIGFADDGTFEPSLESPLGALVTNDLGERIAAVRNSFSLQVETPGGPQSKWRHFISLAEASESGFVLMGLNSIPDVRVDALVKSKWGQSDICGGNCFNYYTPKNYPCGCTATAMAQLMRYYEYPTAEMKIVREQFRITVDGISEYVYMHGGDGNGGPYEWSLMVLEPDCSTTLEQRQAIGALCYDASVAVETEYSDSSSASNLQNARDALVSTFKYSNAIRVWDYDSSIGGDWLNDMVNTNLDAGYPVILGITNKETEAGHAVLADGYGYDFSTLYHHLNMGWKGSDDVWYNLPRIDYAGPGSYDAISGCVYNIFTTGSGEIISGRVTDMSGNPISDATIMAYGGGGPYSAITNDKGIYALAKVRAYSTFTIRAIKSGYSFKPQQVTTQKSGNSRYESGNKWGVDFVGDDTSAFPCISDCFIEDFETVDFNKFPWVHSGSESWTITPLEMYSGIYGAQAGQINGNESTTIKVSLDCVSGDIMFCYKVSSELCCDFLKFYIDGEEKGRWSGTEDWAMATLPVKAGTRTFEWTYSKDGSISRGFDTAWIDDIVFPVDCDKGLSETLQCSTLCDFDGNNVVNFADFAFFASQWLGPHKAGTLQGNTSDSADLNGDGCVDFEDLGIFAENWLVDLTSVQ
jgi:hypothetical protein